MINPRKPVMIAIAVLEKQLWSQQTEVNEHQRYFIKRLQDYRLMIVPVLLLPALLAGWESGKAPNPARRFKQFGEFVLASIIANIKIGK